MKKAYRLFVGLLVLTMSSLAYADVILPEEGATSLDADTIKQNMGTDATVWVQNTFGSDIELYSGSVSVPSNSAGLIIGGTDDTAKIKVQSDNLQNINQTTVNTKGTLTVVEASGTGNYFDSNLIINGGSVTIEKSVYSMQNGAAIAISDGSLTFKGKFRIGYDSAASFTQTGGTVTFNSISGSSDDKFLRIGYKSKSVGELNISGGTFTSNLESRIGDSGKGTINISGGEFIQKSGMNLGYDAKGKGYINVNGGTFTYTVNDLRLGRYGYGELNLTSGKVDLGSRTLVVGYYEGSTGKLTMTGGTLTAQALTLGEKAKTDDKAAANGTATFTNIENQSFTGNVTVGNKGTGSLTLDNSTLSTDGYAYIGNQAGSSGDILLKNNAKITFTSHSMRVGEAGTGAFTMQPGTSYSGNEIFLGNANTATGSLTVDSGTIESKRIIVGSAGTGTMNADNATITIKSGGFFVGGNEDTTNKPAGTGTANISDSTFSVTGDFSIGNYGKGTLTLADSTVTISGAMYIANHTGAEGTATLNDVTFENTLGNVFVGKSGTGTLTLDSTDLSTNGYLVVGGGVDADGKTSGATGTGTINLTNGATLSNTAHSMRIGESGTGTINVKSKSTLASPSYGIHLAHATGGVGTLNIDGGTVNSKNVYVGANGTGVLDVKNGGTLNAGTNTLFIGNNAGTVGTFNMSGSESTVTVGALYIGNKDAKTDENGDPIACVATITGGSLTSSGTIYIGAEKNSLGVLNVEGGTLTGNNELRVGRNGSGTMTIKNNATALFTGIVYVGQNAGSKGVLNVEGGSLSSGNQLIVGSTGSGTMTIKNDATTSFTGNVYVGQNADSEGILNVESGSLFSGNQLIVGNSGSGTMTMTGGSVTAAGNIYVGAEKNSQGVLNVEGGTLTGKSQLRVGRYGAGTMTVKNDAAVTASDVVYVGQYANSSGTLNLEGGSLTGSKNVIIGSEENSKGYLNVKGGTLEAKAELYVGDVGKGSMTISDGSVTAAGKIYVANNKKSTSELNVSGGSLTGNSELIVGYSGNGTMTITGGDVTIAGLTNVGFEAGSIGNLSIKDGTFTNTNSASTFRIGRKGTGTVEVLEGGQLIVENTPTQLGYYSGGDGTLIINGGTAQLKTLQIGYASGSTGALEVKDGTLITEEEIQIGVSAPGKAKVSGGDVIAKGGIVIKNDNDSYLEITRGLVTTPEITIPSETSLKWTGGGLDTPSVKGSLVQNGGTLYPVIEKYVDAVVMGDYNQSAGSIVIDLDMANDQWDTLTVDGDLNLNGTVFVNLTEDIAPIPYVTRYQVFNVTSGNILDVSGVSLAFPEWYSHGGEWALTADGALVMKLPEPSTWALMILGAAGLLYWRKRKNA